MAMTMSRPIVSSPLAGSSHNPSIPSQRITPKRNIPFPSSRALRPFPSIANSIRADATSRGKKPIKLIQPPANQKGVWVLDLTPAELSRQE